MTPNNASKAGLNPPRVLGMVETLDILRAASPSIRSPKRCSCFFGQTAADYEEYNSLSNLDALLLIAGDHTEDDAPKKTSAVQVRYLRATPLMSKPLIEYVLDVVIGL